MPFESNKPVLEHIGPFMTFCIDKGLSAKTIESYKRWLDKFALWLRKNKKENIKPHDLTVDDINQYITYLNTPFRQNLSQKCYLSGLRAFLSYFSQKGIIAPISNIISPLKPFKSLKSPPHYLDDGQINSLLKEPNTNTLQGLRDRLILELLIFQGLKVSRLSALDINDLEKYNFSPRTILLFDNYLKIRNDNVKALFINLTANSKRNRLTNRSIERIISAYGKNLNFPFLITPEKLRWANHLFLLNKEIYIYKAFKHFSLSIKNYSFNNNDYSFISNGMWHKIEKIINEESEWLKNNILSISALAEKYQQDPPFLNCGNCIRRKIAILITGGLVKVRDIDLQQGFSPKEIIDYSIFHHGKEWHQQMMKKISNYFSNQGIKVLSQPQFNHGRADIGFYSEDLKRNFFIEIGTVSLYKIWYNLMSMKNITILVIPSENKILEFSN